MAAVPTSPSPPNPDALPAAAAFATSGDPGASAVADAPRERAKAVAGWVLYDPASTLVGFNLTTNIFPLWVISQGGGDSAIAATVTGASLLAMVIAPIVGTVSDRMPRRIPLLVAFSLAAVVATLPIGHGGLPLGLLLAALAIVGLQASLIVYDALLFVVSTPADRGRISGLGNGIGYLGTIVAIAIGYGARQIGWPMESVFGLSALVFAVLALPSLIWIREPVRPVAPRVVLPAMDQIKHLLAPLREDGDLRRLLVARALYGNAANTILFFTAIYATTEVGFSANRKDVLLLAGTVAAVGGALIWGRAADRIGALPALLWVMGVWALGMSLAAAVPLAHLPGELYWLAAILAGIALGGTWSVDRVLLLELAAPESLGQTLGLFAMVGRAAGLGGPLLWAFVADVLGWGRPVAMLSLLLLIGGAVLALRTIQGGRTS